MIKEHLAGCRKLALGEEQAARSAMLGRYQNKIRTGRLFFENFSNSVSSRHRDGLGYLFLEVTVSVLGPHL